MKKQLLFLTALFISVIGYSQIFNAPDNNNNILQFEVYSATTVRVLDYVSGGTDVDIPATITYNSSTYSVTLIENVSFSGNNLTSVIIPDGVTYIGNYTFEDNLLTNVIIPSSVTFIGEQAFSNNSLTSVTLFNGIIDIDDFAFESNQLTNVTIPSSVTDIGFSVFKDNPSLTCVISEATTPPMIITGTSYDSFENHANIDLSIPSGAASAYATGGWTGFNSVAEGLTGTFVVDNITYQINATPNNEVTVTDYNTAGGTVVDIPDTVSSACTAFTVIAIGNYAFNNNNLTNVTISDSVETIGDGAFLNNSIDNLVLGNNLVNTGEFAFRYNNLTSVTIPNSVITINSNSFQNNNITNLILGNNVETIGNSAFASSDITSIVIPDSVLTIGDGAFVFNDNMSSLVIGNSVTTIGDEAFYVNNSAQLTSITIPSSVTTIGGQAFRIPSLTDVTTLATTPPVITTTGTFSDTFGTNRGNIHLHIPAGTMGAYVTDTGALWTGFNPVTEDALSTPEFALANNIKVINSTDSLEIIANNTVKLENYTIYSITGAKVKEGEESTISITSLSNGIYILKLDFDKGTVVKKVVVN